MTYGSLNIQNSLELLILNSVKRMKIPNQALNDLLMLITQIYRRLNDF